MLCRSERVQGVMLPYCLHWLLTTDSTEVCRVRLLYSKFILLNKCFLAGKLEKSGVLKALCSGFEETTEPAICLSTGIYWWCSVNLNT